MTHMKRLEEQDAIRCAILRALTPGPMRWSDLLKATIQICGTPSRFDRMLRYLVQHNFVERVKIGKARGLRITPHGISFLDVAKTKGQK